MQTSIFSLDTITESLPKEISTQYKAVHLLTANQHNIVLLLHSIEKDKAFVLKIFSKDYYDNILYQKIGKLSNPSLLLPIQTYSDTSFLYFIYPHYCSLTEALSTKRLTYSMIRNLTASIGNAIITMHQNGILHLDITPDNIFLNEEGSFYLGDFSSALLLKKPVTLFSHPYLRTGTTPPFAPPVEMQKSPVSYWNDCYSFALLLYSLFNNGNLPEEDNSNPSSPFGALNTILVQWMKEPSDIHCHLMKEFVGDLEAILTDYDKEKSCNDYFLLLSRDVKPLLFDKTPDCNTAFSSSNDFQRCIKKFSQKLVVSPKLYGLFILCSLLFLFSLYHYSNQTAYHAPRKPDLANNSQDIIIKPTAPSPANSTKMGNASPSSSMNIIIETTSPSPSMNIIAGTASPAPSMNIKAKTASPSPSNNASEENTLVKPSDNTTLPYRILNISSTPYYDNSFLKASADDANADIKILFANHCNFKSFAAFSSLSSLEELYLNDNHIINGRDLTKLPKLKILVLSKCRLTNISFLAKVSSLTVLDLSHNNHLKELRSLSALQRLHYLILTNTNATQKDICYLQKKLPHCTIFY